MYERLKYERHFVYERIDKEGGLCEWKLKHRFVFLPYDLIKVTQYPFLFTPNFENFIDLDESRTKFVIKPSFEKGNKPLIKIPRQLMDGKKDKVQDIVRRFRWINANTFHIINKQGIERVIQIDYEKKEFKELAFNFIPLYDQDYCSKKHYIFDPPSYLMGESLMTFKKRYQHYKTAFYIKKEIVPDYDMNNELFQMDYRIENCQGKFELDMTFSFLHWSIIE
jgi:hypothetical protein